MALIRYSFVYRECQRNKIRLTTYEYNVITEKKKIMGSFWKVVHFLYATLLNSSNFFFYYFIFAFLSFSFTLGFSYIFTYRTEFITKEITKKLNLFNSFELYLQVLTKISSRVQNFFPIFLLFLFSIFFLIFFNQRCSGECRKKVAVGIFISSV